MTELDKRYEELKKEADYYGEDGLIVAAGTRKEAWDLIVKKWREDMGADVDDWLDEGMDEGWLSRYYLHPLTKEQIKKWGSDYTDMVSSVDKSKYRLWGIDP